MNSRSLIPEFFIGFEVLIIVFHNETKIKKAFCFKNAYKLLNQYYYPKATLLNSVTFTSPALFQVIANCFAAVFYKSLGC